MAIGDIVLAVVFAAGVTLLMTWGFSRKGPGKRHLAVFLAVLLLLGAWAVAARLDPDSPLGRTGHWAVFIFTVLAFSLILSAALMPAQDTPPHAPTEDSASPGGIPAGHARAFSRTVSILLYVFIAMAVLMILAVILLR